MYPTTVNLQNMASDSDKQQEKDVSPGVAYDVAARKISEWVGLHLWDDGLKTLSASFQLEHWLLRGSWEIQEEQPCIQVR